MRTDSNQSSSNTADLILHGAIVVTMDSQRRVFRNGALAIKGESIAEVGPSAHVLSRWQATRKLDLSGLVATPGLVNSHIHLTGDNLYPGLEPDDASLTDHMQKWVVPAYENSAPEDDRAAARFVALQMLRQGTTAFIEAATCRHPEAVLDGLKPMGIRGSIGVWAGDLWPTSGVFAMTTQQAIKRLQDAVALPAGRVQVAPSLLGSFTCSDAMYKAAFELANQYNRHWTFHLSPSEGDGAFFRQRTGHDPVVHLEKIGVLDRRCVLGHAIHISNEEVVVIKRSGATVAFSPTSALRLASGVTTVGRHSDLPRVAIGTDALNGSNHVNLLQAAGLACDIYSEARRNRASVTAERALEWLILGGANALGWADRLGSFEPGKRADIAVFDVGTPVFNVANALVHGSPRAIHVFIDGEQVVQNGHVKGEDGIIADAVEAGRRVARRTGLPLSTGWPLLD
jgi:cytosine/adenosine deaminase-related metal-dependent hydrolase